MYSLGNLHTYIFQLFDRYLCNVILHLKIGQYKGGIGVTTYKSARVRGESALLA